MEDRAINFIVALSEHRKRNDDNMQVSYIHAIFLKTICDLLEKIQGEHMQADLQEKVH